MKRSFGRRLKVKFLRKIRICLKSKTLEKMIVKRKTMMNSRRKCIIVNKCNIYFDVVKINKMEIMKILKVA